MEDGGRVLEDITGVRPPSEIDSEAIQDAVVKLLIALGEDPNREGLQKTPVLPFFGKAHVAYLPRGRVLGLSKIPRLVDMFAHRLQV